MGPDERTAPLTLSGRDIVDGAGNEVRLRGVLVGAWLTMENHMIGYSATEEALRESLRAKVGEETADQFFERFLSSFFTAEDARFLHELGVNCIRVPVNHRHLEDDRRPFDIKPSGFEQLDRVIDLCASHGIYTIIDLHTTPGCQNEAWHSDNPTHKALLWRHPHFQDRVANIWRAIAEHYRGNANVAGYNLLNEPNAPSAADVVELTRRVYEQVREVDARHLFFLEGNSYAREFSGFGEDWPDVVYSVHDYADNVFMGTEHGRGIAYGERLPRATLEERFHERSGSLLERGLPVMVGELGAIFSGVEQEDQVRYELIREQIDIYERAGIGWCFVNYKDVGSMGLLHPSATSPWMQTLRPLLAKKSRLGIDVIAGTGDGIRDAMRPLQDLLDSEFPAWNPAPFGRQWMCSRLVKGILLGEAFLDEFTEALAALPAAELVQLAAGFSFEHCEVRSPVARIIADATKQPTAPRP